MNERKENTATRRPEETKPARSTGENRVLFAVFSVVFVSLSILSFSGCEDKSPVTIGFLGDLTGRLSELGIDGRDGAILAVEERNEAGGIGGRPVSLVVKNDEQDREKAVRTDRELIREGVVAIIGHTTSTMSIAAVPAVNEARGRWSVRPAAPTSSPASTIISSGWFRPGKTRPCILPDMLTKGRGCAKSPC